MNEAMNEIIELLKSYYLGNEIYVYIALASALYILIFEKKVRNNLILPLLFIALIVLNPYLYQVIFSKTYAYWRMFWIFSLHLIIGTGFICLMKRLKFVLLQTAIFIVVCYLIIQNGTNVYETDAFEKTISLEKLPDGVVKVCDKILELEEEPLCINDLYFSVCARQYSGKIKQAWGRNADGYISNIGKMTNEYFKMFHNSGDFDPVLNWAVEEGYNIIVIEDDREIDKEICDRYGFEEVYSRGQYRVYHFVGLPEVEQGEETE